eukprot:GHVR01139751.1.p1 GENE.GHVR01139751.1~~GHVR01139751.1.p1  ORF type:complete len:152 (+),score=25.81 GHVR01139751.1:22-456(+)
MQYTRFRNIARCAKFRSDGKVFVASDDNGLVQVVDYEKKTPLRRFKGHSGPVHACDFAIDNTHVLSAGDDQNIRMWDITLGDLVWCHPCHSDYIRCMTPLSSPILVEGSLHAHDMLLKLWYLYLTQTRNGSKMNYARMIVLLKK